MPLLFVCHLQKCDIDGNKLKQHHDIELILIGSFTFLFTSAKLPNMVQSGVERPSWYLVTPVYEIESGHACYKIHTSIRDIRE